MLKALESLWGYAQMAFQFLVNLIEGFINALSLLQSAVTLPLNFTGLVPGIISSSILITITIYVVKFLVGR